MDDALFPVAAPSLPGVDGIAGPGDLLAFPLLSDLALQGWPDWFRAAGLHGQRLPDMHMFNDSTDVMRAAARSEEHTSELQSLMRISYAVFCLKKKKNYNICYCMSRNEQIYETNDIRKPLQIDIRTTSTM